MEGGDIASFFVEDLGLALAPKMCPDQPQAFKEVNSSKAFSVGSKKCLFLPFFFLDEPLQVLQKDVQSFAQILDELTA